MPQSTVHPQLRTIPSELFRIDELLDPPLEALEGTEMCETDAHELVTLAHHCLIKAAGILTDGTAGLVQITTLVLSEGEDGAAELALDAVGELADAARGANGR